MPISIVTINYNGSDDTIKLLESLSGQGEKIKIFVVDNNSELKEKTKLKSYLKENNNITLIENERNFGFSRGNNIGIRKALDPPAGGDTEWIVLLNNDAWVENSFIARLENFLNGKTGVVAISLIEKDETAYCGRILWLKHFGRHIKEKEEAKQEIGKYAIGGAMAIHRDVFAKVGFFDEKYFLYFEDMDFSVRAKRAGFKITIAHELSVYHNASSTTKRLGSSKLLHYHYRNALYFNLKNGPWYVKLAVFPWSWIIAIKQLFKIAINKDRGESRAILAGVSNFYLNRFDKLT